MPARETRLPNGKVRVSTPNGVHAKATTKKKADAQVRILNEYDRTGRSPRRRTGR